MRGSVVARILAITLLAGCSAPNVVPPGMEGQIDTVSFTELRQSPDSHRGRVVVLGGEVLSAKRLKDATRIEVLELPLSSGQDPVFERSASEGRFLAFQREFLDPATVPAGTRVTIVGEVTGTSTQPLDETEYTYPTIDIKTLKVWPKADYYGRRYYPPPYSRPYWGYGYAPWRWSGYPYGPYWW